MAYFEGKEMTGGYGNGPDIINSCSVNVNKGEYTLYMSRYKNREKQSDEMRDTVKEINTLKQELFEIKKLLNKVIKN